MMTTRTKITTVVVQYALEKLRVIGLRKLTDPSRVSMHNYKAGQSFVVIVVESAF